MPRKRSDPAADILTYFRTQSLAVAQLVLSLAKAEVSARQPQEKKVVRRKRQPKAMPAATPVAPVSTPVVQRGRRRRMRAGSQPPMSEATPIVPAVEDVSTYEGG